MSRMVDREGDGAGEGSGGDWLFDKEEGVIYEKLRMSLIVRMVDRDEGDAAEKRRWGFFFIIEQGIITEKGWFFIKKA